MTEQTVDAASQEAPAQSQPEASPAKVDGVEFYKSEAHKAFEARDAAKSRAKELEAQLNELRASMADANDETGNQLKAVLAERDNLANQLSATKAAHRESQILNKLASGTPAEQRGNLELLYRKFADQLDDGEAEPAEVAEKAETFLKQLSPTLFSQPAPQSRGLIPGDGAQKGFDLDRGLEKNRENFKKQFRGTTGVSL